MFLTMISVVSKVLLITFLIFLLVLHLYFRKQYKYWEKKKVPHTRPVFPLGHLTGAMRKSAFTIFKELYEEWKDQRYSGIYLLHTPVLLVNDPDLIKQITVTNFANFQINGTYINKDDPFSEILVALEGKKWKILRSKLSPIFTPGKLKSVFPEILKCCCNMQEVLQEQITVNQVISVKDVTLRFVTDVVLSAIFGMDIDFMKNPKSGLGVAASEVMKPTWTWAFKFFTFTFVPDVAKVLKFHFLPRIKEEFFVQLFRDIVDYREKNNIIRNDLMQLLIELLQNDIGDVKQEEEFEFTFKDLVSLAMTFLMAGNETTSNTFSFALYELAKNLKIQEKLKKEIKEVLERHNNKITYEGIFEMEYLGRIVDETLRKYPVAPVIPRKCVAEFLVPGSDLVIKKGTQVLIPVAGIHRDERYYPSPEKFDPERFTKENKALRPNSTYIPFGEGPRYCIGQRFALLLIKMGLVAFLSKFDVNISEGFTPDTLELDPKSVITAPRGALMLKLSVSNI